MTRAERLARTEARAKAKLKADRQRLAHVQGAQREEARKALSKRRYQVGVLVEQAGLFVRDDATLAGVFACLTTLVQTPDPVAVLASLLGAPERPALGTVDGTAHLAVVSAPSGAE